VALAASGEGLSRAWNMDWSVVLIIVLAVAAVILGAIWYQQRR
jgi:hypothetical protein